MTLNGIALIDKPVGYSSFDIVSQLRNIAKAAGAQQGSRKRFPVGHSGTLDPLASGLLIVLLGSYTKRSAEFMHLDKVYSVKMVLGQTSSTGDEEGIKKDMSTDKPQKETINSVFKSFIGGYDQVPPIYSAIKVGGQRSYKLARSGELPKLEARPIMIYDLTLERYSYPFVSFQTRVGSGTYVRSLVEDIGKALGAGAYTSELRRISVGSYNVKEAVSIKKIDAKNISNVVFEPN
ncbi:MAG TPA: tRNA pseudouridine(55) synthase TruB [Candidatus Saccharimonadales bacterium]|jgi:tRNA pseudouridine55 synthase|nr:tRNA pseudouridine(55) synthase TruB [Candidatus Saccharimonadales bacterium]